MPRLGSRVRVSFPAPNLKDLVVDGVFLFKDLSPWIRSKYKKALCRGWSNGSRGSGGHNRTGFFNCISDCKPVPAAGLSFLGRWRFVLLAVVSLEV